jgi:hypothetical chaperone protein
LTRPVAYGIDFGTTNSSIAAVTDGRVQVLHVESSAEPPEAFRSVVFLHRDGDRWAGHDAARRYLQSAGFRHRCSACDRVQWLKDGPLSECRQFKPGGGCLDARLIAGMKQLLPDEHFVDTSSWAEIFRPQDLVAVVLGRLKAYADERFGPVDRALIGYPVTFETDSAGDLAKERLLEAASEAGFPGAELCPEPIAAISEDVTQYRGRTICSVDFGGGTFDVAVITFDVDTDGSELRGLSGVPVGGEIFDNLLFERFVAPNLPIDETFLFEGADDRRLPAYIRRGLRSLSGTVLLSADPGVYTTLQHYRTAINRVQLEPVTDLIYGGQAYDFWAAVEAAKRDLSKNETTRLRYRRQHIEVDILLERDAFESLLKPFMEEVRRCIETALEQANLAPADIDIVIRTGGSSLLPAFNAVLDELFGAGKVEARPAFSSVAAGLAKIAEAQYR